jgi:predicted dehydrogenase
MSNRSALTRRAVLSHSGKLAVGLGAAGWLARKTHAASRKVLGANERITMGLIGAGNQGTQDMANACAAPNAVCVAVCDVAEFRTASSAAAISKVMENKGNTGVKVDSYYDHRKLLERSDIDAVLIATPDHWHMDVFLAAVEAGKHIYQEKPMSKTLEQGYKMLAAAQKHPELTIQIGTQRRSGGQYPKAKALIDEGKIGDITFARCYDCRNWVMSGDPFAPREVAGKIDWDTFQKPCEHKIDYDPWRYFAWRWYWDYANGLVTDVGVHVLDVVHWLTGQYVPKSVVCNGGVYGMKRWETPDVVNAVWDYGKHSVVFTANFTNGYEGAGLTIYGTKGMIQVRQKGIEFWEEGQRDKPSATIPAEDRSHPHNWLDCIRSGKEPNAPAELGLRSLLPLHLANMAYREGKKITWDAEAQKAS